MLWRITCLFKNSIAVAVVGIVTGVINWLLALAGHIAPVMDAAGNTIAVAQNPAVRQVITFSFVGLEVFTGIALMAVLLFVYVEKHIDWEQAEIKARREQK